MMNKADRQWFIDNGFISVPKKPSTFKLVYQVGNKIIGTGVTGTYQLCNGIKSKKEKQSQYKSGELNIIPS